MDIIKALLVTDIIDEQYTHGTSIIGSGDGLESFLASSIPNLQLDPLVIEINGSDLEINTNGGNKRRSELVFTESQKKT